jgi:hypothetical protein
MRLPIPALLQQRSRLRLLLVVWLFVLSQATGLFHLMEHGADKGSAHCAACSIASHGGNAPLPQPVQAALPAPSGEKVVSTAFSSASPAFPVSYTSRAPPSLS